MDIEDIAKAVASSGIFVVETDASDYSIAIQLSQAGKPKHSFPELHPNQNKVY